jgi:4'-phosphopantetheinyl transferase
MAARQATALPPDEVHVWIAALEAGGPAAELSREERERASRLRFERDQRRFVAAHAFLRRVLAHYLECAPRAVSIGRGANGKPQLAAPGSSVRFNLAHSGEVAVCAVARDREVGVDVERVRPLRDLDALAGRVLSEREQALFRASGGEEAFFTAWTRKEAVLKARGEGLDREPATVDVSGDPEGWTVQAVDVGTGYVAAVAAEGHGWVVRRRTGLEEVFAAP